MNKTTNSRTKNILVMAVIIVPILVIGLIVLLLWVFPTYEHFIYHIIPVDEQNCILVHYFKNPHSDESYSVVERVDLSRGTIWRHRTDYYMDDWLMQPPEKTGGRTLLVFLSGEDNVSLIQYNYENGEARDAVSLGFAMQDFQRIYADNSHIYCGYLSLHKEKREREDNLVALDRSTGSVSWQKNITELTNAFSSTYHPAGYRQNLLVFTSYDQCMFINRDTGDISMVNDVSDKGRIFGNRYRYLLTPNRRSTSKDIMSMNLDTHATNEIKTIQNIGITYFYDNSIVYFNPYSTTLTRRNLETGTMDWQIDLSKKMTKDETFVHPPSGFNTKYCPVWINSHAGNRYVGSILAILDIDTGTIVTTSNKVVIPEENEAMYQIYYDEGLYFIPLYIPKENSFALTVFNGTSGRFMSAFNYITPESTGLFTTIDPGESLEKQKVVIGRHLFFKFLDQFLVYDLNSAKTIYGNSGALRYRNFSFDVETIYRLKSN